jgi:hypothetical protein
MAVTRRSYDAVTAAYADAFSDELTRKPLDRALLAAFAEQVQQQAPARGRVWDIGWLTAELDQAGFAVEALTRRQPYPGAEVATERAYFLARARPEESPNTE